MKKTILVIFPWLMVINLYLMSKADLAFILASPVRAMAQITALLGAVMLSQTFVLSARVKWLESIFGGLDKMLKTHYTVAGISYILLIAHPLFLILSVLPNFKAAGTYILPGTTPAFTYGILGFWALTLMVVLSLYLKLPYHIWRLSHELAGAVLLFGLLHVLLIPSDISAYPPLRWFMLAMWGAGTFAYLYSKILYRYFGPSWRYRLTHIQAVGEVVNLKMEPVSQPMAFTPGQFVFVAFQAPGFKESHPFSISSSPQEPWLRLSVKALGDYTRKLKGLPPGTEVVVRGPHGRFLENISFNQPVVLVAGGIGITPFLSFLRHLLVAKISVPTSINIVSSVKNLDEASHHRELSQISRVVPELEYRLWQTQNGHRLTAADIIKDIGAYRSARYYLCGPAPMMYSLRRQLVGLGIKRSQVKFEDFSFL